MYKDLSNFCRIPQNILSSSIPLLSAENPAESFPRREKEGTYRANVVIRFYDRRKMTAGYIGNLRLMHQSYEILLHFSGEEVLVGKDEKDAAFEIGKVRCRYRFLVHKISEQAGDIHYDVLPHRVFVGVVEDFGWLLM